MQLSLNSENLATTLSVLLKYDPDDGRLTAVAGIKNDGGHALAYTSVQGRVNGDVLGIPDFLRDVGLHWLYGDPRLLRNAMRRSWVEHVSFEHR